MNLKLSIEPMQAYKIELVFEHIVFSSKHKSLITKYADGIRQHEKPQTYCFKKILTFLCPKTVYTFYYHYLISICLF